MFSDGLLFFCDFPCLSVSSVVISSAFNQIIRPTTELRKDTEQAQTTDSKKLIRNYFRFRIKPTTKPTTAEIKIV